MNLLKEVAEKVDRPFSVKLAETKDIIARHLEEFGDKVAVAFSGGKDSEVVLWLCLQATPGVSSQSWHLAHFLILAFYCMLKMAHKKSPM